MFSDLKNVYENVDVNQTKKKIEEWLFKLAELMQNDNNYDNSLDETNQYFAERCGKAYREVGYHRIDLPLDAFILITTISNFNVYTVYCNLTKSDSIAIHRYPDTFGDFNRYIPFVWERLKQLNVEKVYQQILEKQTEENKRIEQEIKKQLDKLVDMDK